VAAGQLRLLGERRPIEAVLADPATPSRLATSLRLVLEARDFAASLGLEVGDQYTSYVAWPGDRVVTSVVATEPGSVEPAGFFFPLIGTVPYKGFFDRQRADAEADALRADGLDVCEVAVPAYSTLGWLDDPVTAPMLQRGDGALVEMIFHELFHATLYIPSHADFNEGVARFVGEEASVRFYAARGEGAPERRAAVVEERMLDAALLHLRGQVEALYATEPEGPARDRTRRALDAGARDAIGTLPLATLKAPALASEIRLNDACLALRGTYASDIDAYAALLRNLGGDLGAFVTRVRGVAAADDPRAALLDAYRQHAAR
jgi:predicted aminopeptidase